VTRRHRGFQRRALRIVPALLGALATLAFAGEAGACVCADQPIGERLDEADAAVVGRVRSVADSEVATAQPFRLMAFEIDQRVKGKIEGEARQGD
jgi:hypothetical protein